MVRHSVTWRMATQDEIERTGCTDKANLTDGAGAMLVDGDLVGICDEYGTCVWWPDYDPAENPIDNPHVQAVERLNEAACELVSWQSRITDGAVNPSFLPPMFCAACEDSGQELDGSPCLHCGGKSHEQRLEYEARRCSTTTVDLQDVTPAVNAGTLPSTPTK